MTLRDELIERIAYAIAGHFGPEFGRLPADRAELRTVRRHSVVYSDNTQDEMREAAADALDTLIISLQDPPVEMVDAALWEHQLADDKALHRGTARQTWLDMLTTLEKPV